MRNSIKIISIVLFVVIVFSQLQATHNRSGEITYSYLYGTTYKIRVTTYTNNSQTSLAADRCHLTVFIDNLLDSITLPRVNGASSSCNNPPAQDGVDITPSSSPGGGFRLNIYEANYTFQGSGKHILYMFDPNRNAGSNNIPNSVNVPFALVDTIYTSNQPGLSSNNSPVLTFPPIDKACAGQIFIHNPGAYDPDKDSLSYSLSTCLGSYGLPIMGYTPPSVLNVTIDQTGTLIWNVPSALGEYNFAILITEWRKDLDGIYHVVGKMLRDLQVNVEICKNKPPVLKPIRDTCIVAGTIFKQLITATDPDPTDIITLTANGGTFNIAPPATFSTSPASVNVTGIYTWAPTCGQVSVQPYLVTIKAQDNSQPVSLVDFESFYIKVVSPPPQNLTAVPSGSNMLLNWQAPLNCGQTIGNRIVNYIIYKKNDCTPVVFDPCQKSISPATGFTPIGSIATFNNPPLTFTDTNNGLGLAQGVDYSYIVVAQFADGSMSVASSQVCQHLLQNVPVMINVSVDTTDIAVGKNWVRWVKPVVSTPGVPNLDTIVNTGPYEFRLLQHNNFTGTFTPIYSVKKQFFAQLNALADTTYTDVLLNTRANPHTYKVDFYSNNTLIGSTQTASSVYLTATGLAKRIQLNWKALVPWTNTKTYIYRQLPSGAYFLRDSVFNLTQYTDTGLVNGKNYCYKVKTVGQYSSPTIYKPLENWSQKVCVEPIDKEPPCAPIIKDISGNCVTQISALTWTNPNNSCSDDALYYNLYYTQVIDSPFVKILTLPINTTSFQTDYSNSIAGCYAVTAVDAFQNESVLSTKACIDNCPEYELPNIITINGDGINDFFIPVKNKFVRDIGLKIYDRWGVLVYETTEPAINWNGNNVANKLPCNDGTYYYVCQVNTIRLKGIETKTLKGFIQILKN